MQKEKKACVHLVNIKGKSNDIAIGVYCKPPNQPNKQKNKNKIELFANVLAKVCRKHITIVMGEFNYPDTNWKITSFGCHHTPQNVATLKVQGLVVCFVFQYCQCKWSLNKWLVREDYLYWSTLSMNFLLILVN